MKPVLYVISHSLTPIHSLTVLEYSERSENKSRRSGYVDVLNDADDYDPDDEAVEIEDGAADRSSPWKGGLMSGCLYVCVWVWVC